MWPRGLSRDATARIRRLTVTVGDGHGVTPALALLHHGRPEGLQALVRRLPGVGQTLDRPHLLSQAALGRTLEQKKKQQQSGRLSTFFYTQPSVSLERLAVKSVLDPARRKGVIPAHTQRTT